MNHQLTTLAVLLRWLRASKQVQEQMWAARSVVVARQLAVMRGTYS